MALTKERKTKLFDSLGDVVSDSKSIVFVGFNNLDAGRTSELRSTLRSKGISYKVAKKRILKKALEKGSFSGTMPEMGGEMAIVYKLGDNGEGGLLDPSKEVFEFVKKWKDNMSILGGVYDGVYKPKDEMMAVAQIPGRDTLYAQIANLFASPITRLAISLNEVAKTK
ncbi:50S ribosomal protein L10 [Candidatus Nomurabacteria bacterium]|nr:50S ribosomal protein L10 [Candidatus Nomurabacteria bacterium]USN94559.1 MAG: 50S ribosomal protein L10 [Candidatus Nomurabacteria bacterium]